LARKILLLNEENFSKFGNFDEMVNYINQSYLEFISGDKYRFNYDRNKTKTELLKMYNHLNRVNCEICKEEYICIDHINYQLIDFVRRLNDCKREA
jgi:ArsR family metal-binding transcriptional regulator